MFSMEVYHHTSFPFDQNPKHPWPVFPCLKPLPTCGLCSWCGLIPQASLCHSFHVPLPITFTPILLLTSIPGPASRSVQLRDEPQACMTATAQHREHIQMNFYRQVQLISTVEQNSVTSGSSSDAQPLHRAHSHPPILKKGVAKSDYYAHRLQLPVSPSKTQKISAPLCLLSSPTSNYYHHYTKKWVSFGWFV